MKQQKEKDRYADDDYYYDRDDEYGSPKAPASNYEAPAASSYNPPAPSYAAPSYQAPAAGYGAPPSYEATGGGGGGGGGYGPEQTPQQQLPDDEVDQRAVPFTGYGDYDFDLYQYPSPVVQVIKQNTNKRIAAPAAAAA